ncbi:MAG: metal-dependent transcriptional regulator [Owenweeksia sp.]
MSDYTLTEENYLKAIYFLSQNADKGVSTNSISESLETKPSTVTEMLRKLKEKGVLNYKKYQGAELTEEGEKVAISTVRKHRLWECFLVDKLNFGWEEVHEIAEQLEHIQSRKLTDRLEEFLGFPKYDPHGDPIPDKNGIFPHSSDLTLDNCMPGEMVKVRGVKDTAPEFLKYIAKLGIGLGDQIKVVEIEEFDRSMRLSVHGQELQLSSLACKNIFVQ